MKKTLASSLLAVSLTLLTTPANATISITVNSNGGPKFMTSTASQLTPANSTIRVGVFDTSGGNAATIGTSNNFATVNALFKALLEGNAGGGNISAGTINHGDTNSRMHINDAFAPNDVFAEIENISPTYLKGPNPGPADRLYLWVFNNSNPTLATEWGIFTSNSSANWLFPSDFASATLSTFDINSALRGSTDGGLVRLAVVPEPAGLVLVAMGTLLIAGRRRRA